MKIKQVLLFFICLMLSAISASAVVRSDPFNPIPNVPWTSASPAQVRTWMLYEDAYIRGRMFDNFVYSGGLHGVSASLVAPAFATEAFVPERVNQTAAVITYAAIANDVCWTIISSQGGTIVGWTRVGTTAYYFQCEGDTTPNQPLLPANSTWLMQVTITGNAISAVSSMKNMLPLQIPGWTFAGEFGVLCDGVTDDAPAMQRMVDSVKNSTTRIGGRIVMPPHVTCLLNSTVMWDSFLQTTLDGNASTFQWNGDTTGPVLRFRDVRDSDIGNFWITIAGSKPAVTGIQSERGLMGLVSPTRNRFHDLRIECVGGSCDYPFRIVASGPGGDGNNELHSFERTTASNYAQAAYKIEANSAHNIEFQESACSSNLNGNYCVWVVAGSFHWSGGGGGGNKLADFRVDTATLPITIKKGTFEDSARLAIILAAPGAVAVPLSIAGVRWATLHMAGDGRIVILRSPGPTIIENNFFDGDPATNPRIYIEPSGTVKPRATIHSNVIVNRVGGQMPSLLEFGTGTPKSLVLSYNNYYTNSADDHTFNPLDEDQIKPPTIDVRSTGAQCRGSLALSAFYTTLASAQTIFPHVVALTQQLDWAAVQMAINIAPVGSTIVVPTGVGCQMGTDKITWNKSLTLQGQGWSDNAGVIEGSILQWGNAAIGLQIGATGLTLTPNIEKLALITNATGTAIDLGDAANPIAKPRFRDVLISGWTNGIDIANTTQGLFDLEFNSVTTKYVLGATIDRNTFLENGTVFQTGVLVGGLGTPPTGTMLWCRDCNKADPCAGGGTGAWALRTSTPAWRCD